LATDGIPTCVAHLAPCVCHANQTTVGDQCCVPGYTPPSLYCAACNTGLGDPAAEAVNEVQQAAQMGVHTFVIGIGTGSHEDMELNQLAQAGGEARPNGPPYYYLVTSQQQLVSVINAIAGQIISCSFDLPMRPPDPDLVSITANGQMVPRDPSHMNGWDYGPGMMSIQFYGSYCQNLQSGMIMNVMAIFGCPPIGIHR